MTIKDKVGEESKTLVESETMLNFSCKKTWDQRLKKYLQKQHTCNRKERTGKLKGHDYKCFKLQTL